MRVKPAFSAVRTDDVLRWSMTATNDFSPCAAPAAPFFSLFDELAFVDACRAAGRGLLPAQAAPGGGAGDDAMDVDADAGAESDAGASLASPESLARALRAITTRHGKLLSTRGEAVRAAAALCGDVLACERSPAQAVEDACEALRALCVGGGFVTVALAACVLKELLPCLLYGAPPAAASVNRSQPTMSRAQKACRAAALEVALCVADSTTSAAAAALSRQLCLRAPERADLHNLAIEAARDLVHTLPLAERHRMGRFLAKLSKNGKPVRRQVAVELAGELLATMPGAQDEIPAGMEMEIVTPGSVAGTPGSVYGGTPSGTPGGGGARSPFPVTPGAAVGTPYASTPASATAGTPQPTPGAFGQSAPLSWGASCAGVVVSRASDRMPAVRAKALAALAVALRALTAEGFHGLVARAASASPGSTLLTTGAHTDALLGFTAPTDAGTKATASTPVGPTPMDDTAGREGINAAARASARAMAPLLYRRVTDVKPAVRKAALAALESLCTSAGHATREDIAALSACCSDSLVSVRRQAAASLGAMCACLPNDPALARAVAETVLPLAADPEAQVADKAADVCEQVFLAPLVTGDASAAEEVASTLGALADAPSAMAALPRALGALHARKAVKPAHVRALQACCAKGTRTSARAGALALLAQLADCAPGAVSAEFITAQWKSLDASSSVEEDSSMADVLRIIAKCGASALSADAGGQMTATLAGRLAACAASPATVSAMMGAAIALGGTRVLPPLMESAAKRVVRAVTAGDLGTGFESGVQDSAQSATLVAALFMLGESALILEREAPAEAVTMTQALLGAYLERSGDASSVRVPSVVRAHAWCALGKMCVAYEPLAKKCAVLFVAEAESGAEAASRNNALVALSDLCVRYTAVVDGRMERLASCLRDPCELVRRQAMLLLASLLQRDYLKWRGAVFHRFCLALVDESPAIRDLATHLLGSTLAAKVPMLAHNHFVEAFFVLNACTIGPGAGAAVPEGAKARSLFCLEGTHMRSRRLAVYRRLLATMTPEQRFASTARLCSEVLGCVADGGLPVNECEEVIADVLSVLASKEAQTGGALSTSAGASEPENAMEAVAAAKGRVVSQLMRKNTLENVVPVLVELRALLQRLRSPLQGHMLGCACDVLRPHRNELRDALAADPLFAAEVADEMRRRDATRAAGMQAQQQQPSAQSAHQPAPQQPAEQAAAAPANRTPATAKTVRIATEATPNADANASPMYAATGTPGAGLSGGTATLRALASAGTPRHSEMSVPRLRTTRARTRAGAAAALASGSPSPGGARRVSGVAFDGSEGAQARAAATVCAIRTPDSAAAGQEPRERWNVTLAAPTTDANADAEDLAADADAAAAEEPKAGMKRARGE